MDKALALGTGGVAVTLGAEGALVAEPAGEPARMPVIAVDDTTGCGDGFNAARPPVPAGQGS